MDSKAIHIGQMIEQEMSRQLKSASWLAQEIHLERSSIYKIYHRDTLDVNLLVRISLCLDHDFFKDLSELLFDSSDRSLSV